jgi:bromodomain adjacent to zinc finger domain protein 1A
LAALEPKKETNGDHPNGETNGDVDVEMEEHAPPSSRPRTPTPPAGSISEEHDELETPPPSDDELENEDQISSAPAQSSPVEPHGAAGASRRLAMARQAASKAEEEALRLERIKAEKEDLKAKSKENKAHSIEKRRLLDEEERLNTKLRELELDFRTYIYTLRSRPLGVDRFGNKYWYMDGIGSGVALSRSSTVENGLGYGTGRIYVQGVEEEELEYMCLVAEVDKGLVDSRRAKEEGEGRLGKGEWGVYDTTEQVRLASYPFVSLLPSLVVSIPHTSSFHYCSPRCEDFQEKGEESRN